MASIEAFVESDKYGLLAENLSRELLVSRGHGFLANRTEWPVILPADDEVWWIGQRLANKSLYTGWELTDRQPTTPASILLNQLVEHRLSEDNEWLRLMHKEGDSNFSRNNDFNGPDGRVETKHDGRFSGRNSTTGKFDRKPSFNLFFEMHDDRGNKSGMLRDHDFVCYVVDNRFGEPILAMFAPTSHVRKFIKKWSIVKGSQDGGNNDNAVGLLLWLPYYLSDTYPTTEDE